MTTGFSKTAATKFIAGFDFQTYPLNPGETVVASNANGTTGVSVRDADGADVTNAMTQGAPTIAGTSIVKFWLIGGVPGAQYTVEVTGATSDDEILTEEVTLTIDP